MRQYLDLLQHILDNGTDKTDRTRTGTLFRHSEFYFALKLLLFIGFI